MSVLNLLAVQSDTLGVAIMYLVQGANSLCSLERSFSSTSCNFLVVSAGFAPPKMAEFDAEVSNTK